MMIEVPTLLDRVLKYLPLIEVLVIPAIIYVIVMTQRFAKVESNVDTIMTNHLPHIDEALKEIKSDVRQIWLILTNKER